MESSQEKINKDKEVSVWYMSELLKWHELGLLPAKNNQDIEYYCSFSGAYDVASGFQGMITLVHGPSGCVESFTMNRPFPGSSGKFKPKAYSSNMDLSDVVFGAHNKLSQAIIQVDREKSPHLILVITNCCADIIGEDVDAVIKKIRRQVKADVISVETGGCSGDGFRAGADKAFKRIFEYVSSKTKRPTERTGLPSVNIFTKRISGRPAELEEVAELERLLGKARVTVNTVIRLGSHYDDLLRIPKAHCNAALCYLYGDGPMEYLNALFKQPYTKANFPIGLEGTLKWLKEILEVLGLARNLLTDDPEVEEYRKKIDAARRRYEGREAFIWMPGEKGLALARFAAEVGMKPYLFTSSYFAVKELNDTMKLYIKDGYDFPTILTGKNEILAAYKEQSPENLPILFMPKKFWTGELPTATINCFADPILGLRGIDVLLGSMEKALSRAGKKDYALFNRYVETRLHAIPWDIEGPVINGSTDKKGD